MTPKEAQATEETVIETSGPDRVRQAVIENARRLFAERGIHAVSVREIAREVGVSHTLLHLYFGSKEEIVRQVLNSYDSEFAAELVAAPELDKAVGQVFRQIAGEREMVRVLAAALVEGIVPHRIEAEAKAQKAVSDRLKATGASGDVDPRVVSVLLASMAIGWAVAGEWLSEGVGLAADEATEEQLAQLLEGLVRDCL